MMIMTMSMMIMVMSMMMMIILMMSMIIARKLAKECQYCAAYEDVLIDYKFEKNCERHEKPNCYTAYKEVTIT